MGATNYFCRHFHGMHKDKPCDQGLDPDQFRDRAKPATLPCHTTERHHECPAFAGYTAEEIAEDDRAIADFIVRLAAQHSGQSDKCVHCEKPIEKLEQVGRCVYARPCGCRQFQGKVPAAWKAKKP